MAIIQVPTPTISFLASSFTAFMEAHPVSCGLKSPYRRIIFGLSVSDIIQSIALFTGPWSTPSGVSLAPWGAGNIHTCRLNGALLFIGGCSFPMYIAGLSIYYVYKLRQRMSDETFTRKVEWKIHAVIIACHSFILVPTILGLDAFHSTANPGTICFVAPMPTGCSFQPEIYGDCENNLGLVRCLQGIYPLTAVLSLITILISLGLIFCQASTRSKWFQSSPKKAQRRLSSNGGRKMIGKVLVSEGSEIELGFVTKCGDDSLEGPCGQQQGTNRPNLLDLDENDRELANSQTCVEIKNSEAQLKYEGCQRHEEKEVIRDFATSSLFLKGEEESSSDADNGNRSREPFKEGKKPHHEICSHDGEDERVSSFSSEANLDYLSRLYKNEMIIQACCYLGVFFISQVPAWLLVQSCNGNFITGVNEIWATFYPLGGLFNIIVFTRPQVASFRRKYPECSRIQAFWLVLKNGGEMPDNVILFRSMICCQKPQSDLDVSDNNAQEDGEDLSPNSTLPKPIEGAGDNTNTSGVRICSNVAKAASHDNMVDLQKLSSLSRLSSSNASLQLSDDGLLEDQLGANNFHSKQINSRGAYYDVAREVSTDIFKQNLEWKERSDQSIHDHVDGNDTKEEDIVESDYDFPPLASELSTIFEASSKWSSAESTMTVKRTSSS